MWIYKKKYSNFINLENDKVLRIDPFNNWIQGGTYYAHSGDYKINYVYKTSKEFKKAWIKLKRILKAKEF